MPAPPLEILVLHEARELGRFELPPGEYRIGRSPDCQIPIPLESVAREHAKLTVAADGSTCLEDLASESGTFLDSACVEGTVPVLANQTIQIGPASLLLLPRGSELDATIASTGSGVSVAGAEMAEPLEVLSRERYRLGRELAKGGMGAVHEAREVPTRRTVAMKVMLPQTRTDERSRLRFVEEAQITAQLEHPNIVPVHELGVDAAGGVFYTMKLVQGTTLQDVLRRLAHGDAETARQYPLASLLTVFQKICDALAFAHARHVIHRDLKPANIMVGHFGEVLVMDWGLAKLVGHGAPRPSETAPAAPVVVEEDVSGARSDTGDAYATIAGDVVGTAPYMAPEQARGETHLMDARSDIFSLGVILYEILTLQRPFPGQTGREVLQSISQGASSRPIAEAVFISSLTLARRKGRQPEKRPSLPHLPDGTVPESMAAVVLKALAFMPGDRYQSLQALQADLTAYQSGFATAAERAGAWKQAKLFVRRNRAVSIATAAALLLLAATSAGFTLRVLREKHFAETQRALAQSTLLQLQLNRGLEALENDQPGAALAWFAKVLRADHGHRVAGRLIVSTLSHHNFILPAGQPLAIPSTADKAAQIKFFNDGTLLTFGRACPTARWDVGARQQLGPALRPSGRATILPGGKQLLLGGAGDPLEKWDIDAGQRLQVLGDEEITDYLASPDGTLLVTQAENGRIALWDGETFALRRELRPAKPDRIDGLRFDAQSRRFLISGQNLEQTQLWDFHTSAKPTLIDATGSVEFHPGAEGYLKSSGSRWSHLSLEGKRLVTGVFSPRIGNAGIAPSSDGSRMIASYKSKPDAELWDLTSGRALALLSQSANITAAQFLPNDWRIVTYSGPEIRLWSGRNGKPLAPPATLSAPLSDGAPAAISPDATLLAKAGPGQVAFFHLQQGAELPVILQLPEGNQRSILSQDGRFIINTTDGGSIQRFDAATGEKLGEFGDHNFLPSVSTLVGDGTRLAMRSTSFPTEARCWDVTTGELLRRIPLGSDAPALVRIPAHGETMAAAWPGHVAAWSVAEGRKIVAWEDASTGPTRLHFTPDGRLLLYEGEQAEPVVFDASTGQPKPWKWGRATALDFAPDSSLVAFCQPGGARLFDTRTGTQVGPILTHGSPVSRVRFNPQGTVLAACTQDETIQLWDLRTGQSLGKLLREPGKVTALAFSPNGERLATGTNEGVVRLWDLRSSLPLTAGVEYESSISNLQFTPDGHRLMVSSIQVTRMTDLPEAPLPSPAWLADLAEAVAGERINAQNEPRSTEAADLWALRDRLFAATSPDEYHGRWLRWFFAPRGERTRSASSPVMIQDALDALAGSHRRQSLELALQYRPVDSDILFHLAKALRAKAEGDAALLSDAFFLEGIARLRLQGADLSH